MRKTEPGTARAGLFFISLAAAAAFLFSIFIAAAPGLHDLVHHDAGQSQHECAITVVSSGKYQLEDAPRILSGPESASRPIFRPSLHPVWVAASFASARIFEHAPPALS